MIPLPSGNGQRSPSAGANSVALPPSSARNAGPSIPLPSSSVGFDEMEADFDEVPAAPAVRLPPSSASLKRVDSREAQLDGAIPLPGAVPVGPSEELSFDEGATDHPYAPPPPGYSDATVSAPSPYADSDRGFNLVDAPPPPAPPRAPATAPAPSAPGGFELDFDGPPDFPAAPPPPAPRQPTADPGGDPFAAEMDPFSGNEVPASPAHSGGGGEDLEFDPTAPAAGKARNTGGDDLEADLAAPLPNIGAASTGEDLELLDFIDDAAAQVKNKARPGRQATAGETFQVRNRQGKVVGPVDEAGVVKMLGDGKLLGNEEITQDGQNWVALGSHPVFAAALQRIMEAPGAMAQVPQNQSDIGHAADVNERIKQVYAGRMAGITIIDSQESIQQLKKRAPMIAAAATALLILGIGFSQGFTPNGIFWRKRLFPVSVKPGSALYQKILDGRADLEVGSFGALKHAQTAASNVLNENDQVVQARALFALSTFALQERYGTASADTPRAQKYVEDMWVTNSNLPEVVAAKAAEELLVNDGSSVRPNLEKVLTGASDWNPQLRLLLARSYAKSKDPRAKDAFAKAETEGKAHGAAYLQNALYLIDSRDPAGAGTLLQKALTEDENNGPVGVELAALRVGQLNQPDKAEPLLNGLLKNQDLSPEELARVHALLGMVRIFQKKHTEAEDEFKLAIKLAPSSAPVEAAYGGYLLKRRDFAGAEPLFSKAHDQKPDDLDTLDGLVNAMVGQGHYVDASRQLSEAEAKSPNNARIQYLKGLVSEGADKLNDAEKSFKTARTLDPKLIKADIALGQFYLRHHRLAESKDVLSAALKKAPDSSELNTTWGELALAEGRIDDAATIFDQALKLDPDSAPAHLGRGRVLLYKGDLPNAHQEADTVLKLDDKLPGNHRLLGQVLQAEKDYPKAKVELTAALKQDERDEDAELHLGQVQVSMGDFDSAQTVLENALSLNHSNPETHFQLALAHFKKHEMTQAIDEMTKAMEFGGATKPDYHYQFGLIYKAAEGRFSDAVEEFRSAVKLKPTYADALEALGDSLAESNDFANAVDNYEKALNADNTRLAMLGKEGDCLAKAGKHKEAIEAYKRHLQADSSAVGDYYKIGRAYDDLGKRNDAITAYKESTVKDKGNAMAWYYLGYAYKERGRGRDAISAFEQYLKLNPKAEDKSEVQEVIDGLRTDMGGR